MYMPQNMKISNAFFPHYDPQFRCNFEWQYLTKCVRQVIEVIAARNEDINKVLPL